MIRKPAVAGQFYPGNKEKLQDLVQRYLTPKVIKEDVLGVVAPHAGYIYSGEVAGATYSKVKERPTVIILGVNHRGLGRSFAVYREGTWETPISKVGIATEVVERFLSSSAYLQEDPLAHQVEHSLEVQIPFLQIHFKNPFKIIPISISYGNLRDFQNLGRELAAKIEDSTQFLIIASTDFTHYEPQGEAERKDGEAIKAILSLDEEGLFNKVQQLNISMCGYAPTIVMLTLVKALGAKEAELVKYMTSGDITGDYNQVVGYAGIIIK